MGTLYVVATPIGNLQDITLRAIEILRQVDKIAAEDTRHASPLLQHFSINKPTISLHEFNEREKTALILAELNEGSAIALISDAGTPLISDPGFHLVREARANNVQVVPIPGACAAITALCIGGLPTDKFVFEGFLTAKTEARRNRLAQLLHEARTLVFYEAPHRLLSTLQSMQEVFGPQRRVTIARELTKLHETIITGKITEVLHEVSANTNAQKGEIVILVEGIDEAASLTKEVIPADVLDVLLTELPLKQAVSLTAKITGERKNVLYELALGKKSKQS